jgi:hypothetical protein
LPLVTFAVLLAGGYLATRPPNRPVIEGRPVWEWAEDLHDGTIGLGSTSAVRSNAIEVLGRHDKIALDAALAWSQRTASRLERTFENIVEAYMVVTRRNGSPYGYGEFAHAYRGQGAMVLGILATNHPAALLRLRQMVKEPRYTDYEKQLAQRFIDDIDTGISE